LQTKDGVQEQANQDELTNASIAPALIFE
jgi:hypothetical protein